MINCNLHISQTDKSVTKYPKVMNKIKKGNKLMTWNKGNSVFLAKKDEIEILISDHKPLCLGILEANVEPDCHLPALAIDGYKIELDKLWESGKKMQSIGLY